MQEKKSILKNLADILNPYSWITALRNIAFDRGCIESRSFDLPIICIGNITVGGTGKTPHTEYLIRLLDGEGKVAVLSRGYGRRSRGYIKADAHSTMELIGDEPFQIKSKFPHITVAVCEKRVTGVENLLKEKDKPSVILLDDAFQHRHIKAGLNILLIDSNRPIGDDCILPIGRLRESGRGARRADVVIFTKCSKEIGRQQMEQFKKQLRTKEGTPVFFSTVEYGTLYPVFKERGSTVPAIDDKSNILLLTGIAKPTPLKKELEARGAQVTLLQYADHHNFSDRDFADIAKSYAAIEGRKFILTTEKDATRLRGASSLPQSIKENTYALPIEIKILNDEEYMFNQIIKDYVKKNRRDR